MDTASIYSTVSLLSLCLLVKMDDHEKHTSHSVEKVFQGIRRISDCKGFSICNNQQCPHIQEFNKFNTVEFEPSGLEQVCSCCGELADHSPCEAGSHDAMMRPVLLFIMKGNTLALL